MEISKQNDSQRVDNEDNTPAQEHTAATTTSAADLVGISSRETPKPAVKSAAELVQVQAATRTIGSVLRRKMLGEGERFLARPVTDQVVSTNVHYRMGTGDGQFITLRCNGATCAPCLAQHRPSATGIVPMYCLDERDIVAMSFDLASGPGSLGGQLLGLLARPDHLQLVLDIAKQDRRYTINVLKVLDPNEPAPNGIDYGDTALHDILARGAMPTPEDILATIEARPNRVILMDSPWVAQRLTIYCPELDPSLL